MTEKEIVHGSQLRITEKDILSALPFGIRVCAFFLGGVFYMPDPTPKKAEDNPMMMKPRAAVTYLPSLPKRLYHKYVYKHFRGFARMLGILYGKRTFNPYAPKGTHRE